MCVILLVTRITIRRCSLEDAVLMARITSHLCMGSLQLEIRKIVIEFSWLPAIRRMASLAVGAKTSLMRVVSTVAGIAVLWRRREVGQAARISMALRTGHFLMFPRQFELKAIVLELFAKSVYPIMTIQTGCAIRLNMRLGIAGVHMTVAGTARVRCEGRQVGLVTICAGEWFILGCELVPVQGKSHQLMRELTTLHHGKSCIHASMFGMAITTFQLGVFLVHGTMQSNHVLHLLRDLAMTVYTQVSHRDRRPRRAVTSLALAARLSVRGNPTQHPSRLRIQRAGIKEQSSPGISYPRDHQDGDDR